MGCCCSKPATGADESIKEGMVPLEVKKDKKKFPEDTESTQQTDPETKRSNEKLSAEPIDDKVEKSKSTKKSSKRASLKVTKDSNKVVKSGNKKSNSKSKKEKEKKAQSKPASSINNTDREYRCWYTEMRKRFPEKTDNTQPTSEAKNDEGEDNGGEEG
ncbi:unnamed protein product [Bursaphelenchus okinawaensis]|uniref:Uncharacterized protein n=1 Tax=Bursaphelenchus okinawaensis TaxID=465554 RepID=A0A811L336_9BILA|nr:unnamed protein product [Bursaphelenchus okinawaensis]CAG9118094.1 unnamed protein product [Bursaphelenchus okinawaensis]